MSPPMGIKGQHVPRSMWATGCTCLCGVVVSHLAGEQRLAGRLGSG